MKVNKHYPLQSRENTWNRLNTFIKVTINHKDINHSGPDWQLGRAVNQTIASDNQSTGPDSQPQGQPDPEATIKDT